VGVVLMFRISLCSLVHVTTNDHLVYSLGGEQESILEADLIIALVNKLASEPY
jgi:hypothetical protein